MTWRELLAEGEACLLQAGIADGAIDAWYLLEHLSGMDRAGYFLHQGEHVPPAAIGHYRKRIKSRSSHVPLQHLTCRQDFMGLEFTVSPETLIPRQDTELLAEMLLPLVEGKRVLDLCTGSGCIAVALAVLGMPAKVDAADLSESALGVARENARRLGAEVTFYQGDLFVPVCGKYDVIVSNPPYIATETIGTLMPEVRDHEPNMALDGGEDGLVFYRCIAAEAGGYLEPGGMVWLEIGYGQREDVTAIFQEQGYADIMCYQDLCGVDRVISVRNVQE